MQKHTPRAGQGELSIRGHGDILDEVSVSKLFIRLLKHVYCLQKNLPPQGALGLVLSVLAVRNVPGQDSLV